MKSAEGGLEMPKMIDWNSRENHVLINPRMPEAQARFLLSGIEKGHRTLEGHLFILSSGTTATSAADWKWVALSKAAFLNSANKVNAHLKATPEDTWLQPLPDFHVGGLGIWARSFLSGARVVQLDKWDSLEFLKAVENHKVTLTSLVPAQIYDLVQKQIRCPGRGMQKQVRAILVGGGALSPRLYSQALALGWPLLPTYGMSEACSQIATAPLESVQVESEIRELPRLEILPHWDLRLDEGGRAVLRGPSLLTGYFTPSPPHTTDFTFKDPKIDGWFYSQDRLQLFENRYLNVLGRDGDFIKIGGESVDLAHLRSRFEEIRIRIFKGFEPETPDCVLLPVPDSRLGHVIHLLTDLNGRKSPHEEQVKELIQHFNSQVLAFERIRQWHQVDRIPRTELGKLISAECLSLVANLDRQSADTHQI